MTDVAVAAPAPGHSKPGRWFYVGVLLWLGIGWGSTHPLGKIATETGHGPFGLIFWQQVVMVVVLGSIALVRRKGISLTPAALRFYVIVAVLGHYPVPSALPLYLRRYHRKHKTVVKIMNVQTICC